ncbi:MAG TPA: hypothetical protein VJ124_20305 [Pyrinomonadaceae bacterium]|nr:hypothetical protein [Pyrinomonadaceae bacterium]
MDVTSSADKAIIQAFAKLDKTALGFSVGTVSGLTVFLATILLLVKGGDPLGPNLALLGQFFLGYTVTMEGALVGLFYGFLLGFVLGWVTAFLRNFLLNAYLLMVKTRANLNSYFESID